MSTTAHAHPNIALIKYWGKAEDVGNIPATPSLSLTISKLETETSVCQSKRKDQFLFDDQEINDIKLATFLYELRQKYSIPPIKMRTKNNFPRNAGLASSSSGIAALVTAINSEFELGIDTKELTKLARMGSGSAARSIYGGIVKLQGPSWEAEAFMEPNDWPLEIVIAITDYRNKKIPSSEGMKRSRASSPYYQQWLKSTKEDYEMALECFQERNFEKLILIAEANCLKMHSVMLTTTPSLLYWNSATIACIHQVRALREQGIPVFFTIDAGPQVKAICLPKTGHQVRKALIKVPGVLEVVSTTLGKDAWTETPR
tara:strand:- start:393 stop:1340 length:948 start_codon:yes stop_codon:yes gene_type:complete